jgi:hypothetical protein
VLGQKRPVDLTATQGGAWRGPGRSMRAGVGNSHGPALLGPFRAQLITPKLTLTIYGSIMRRSLVPISIYVIYLFYDFPIVLTDNASIAGMMLHCGI